MIDLFLSMSLVRIENRSWGDNELEKIQEYISKRRVQIVQQTAERENLQTDKKNELETEKNKIQTKKDDTERIINEIQGDLQKADEDKA